MKPVKILHYVEESYGHKPSYIILMSDNKEYISNGCEFVENTKEKIEYLIRKYNCKKELDELLSSSSIANNKLVNGSYMFMGCKNITEPGNYPLLKDGRWMYYGCKNISEPGDYPLLKNGSYMHYGCINVTKPGDYPLLEIGTYMYYYCKNMAEPGDYPLLEDGTCMYYCCMNVTLRRKSMIYNLAITLSFITLILIAAGLIVGRLQSSGLSWNFMATLEISILATVASWLMFLVSLWF